MSERLHELQRQRTLLQEHLAWLDREIVVESGAGAKPPVAPVQAPIVPPVASTGLASATDKDREADALLAQYREQTGDVKQDVRRGCWLYFAVAGTLLGAAVLALYLYSRSRH